MKNSLLFLMFFAFLLRGSSQVTISITPQVLSSSVNPDSFEIRAKATIKNLSNVTKKFSWRRNIMSLTNGWLSLVCDKNQCWAAATNDPTDQIELTAGATSNLDVYIRPDRKMGSATIEIKVFEVGNEANNSVTGRFLFSTLSPVKSYNALPFSNIKLYPNPSMEYFQISENDTVDKVVIYNIIGRQLRIFKATDGNKYMINDLPDGMYIVRLMSSNGATVKTLRLSKAHARA